VDISVGSKHCLALSSKGQLFGWGKNSFLQTGYLTDNVKNLFIHEHMTNMNMVTRETQPETKGSSLLGCPHHVKEFTSVNPVRIFAGDNHSFVLAKNKVEFI